MRRLVKLEILPDSFPLEVVTHYLDCSYDQLDLKHHYLTLAYTFQTNDFPDANHCKSVLEADTKSLIVVSQFNHIDKKIKNKFIQMSGRKIGFLENIIKHVTAKLKGVVCSKK